MFQLNQNGIITKVSAYGVHVLTATGAALGLWALALVYNGYYKEAFWVLAISVFVDGIDGTLARAVDIEKWGDKIDGSLLDNLVDYLTWTIVPLFWGYAVLNLPIWVLLVCSLASALAFSNKEAKTGDNFFLGFPSYWNIVVFYLFLLHIPDPYASAILIIFAVASLTPIKFIYPSKTPYFKSLTLFLAVIYLFQMVILLYLYDDSPIYLVYSSFIFPLYYFGLSFYFNLEPDET